MRDYFKRSAAILFLSVMSVLMFGVFAPKDVNAEDVTANFSIDSVDIFKAATPNTYIDKDRGTNPADYADGLDNGDKIGLIFRWSIYSPTALKEGDQVTFYINQLQGTAEGGYINMLAIGETDILAQDGTKIGKWTMVTHTTTRRKVTMTFNDKIATSAVWSGLCVSPASLTRQNPTEKPVVRSLNFFADSNLTNKLGEIQYRSNESVLSPLEIREPGGKGQIVSSNESIVWALTLSHKAEVYLTDPINADILSDPNNAEYDALVASMYQEDIYIEDEMEDSIGLGGRDIVVRARWTPPVSSSDSRAAKSPTGIKNLPQEVFAKLVQEDGETKDQFRDRIKSKTLQYGAYIDSTGHVTVMCNVGTWPNKNITYAGLGIYDSISNSSSETSFWTDERKNVWKNVHAADNCLDGALTDIECIVEVKYPTVAVDTTVTNIAQYWSDGVYYDNIKGTSTMKPAGGSATPQPGTVTLTKYDEQNNAAIGGAKFKIEKLEGGTWSAVASQTEKTTDASGIVSFSDLEPGDYRLVEVTAAPNYDINSVKFFDKNRNEITPITGRHFTVTGADTEGVTMYASNKRLPGSVKVSKTVSGTAADTNKEFNFTITLKDATDAPLSGRDITIDSSTTTTTSEGKASFKLKHGNSVVIGNIPHGTKYVITEDNAGDYTVTKSNDVGTIQGGSTPTEVKFTNTRSYTPVMVRSMITKSIVGSYPGASHTFTYQLKGVSKPASVTKIPMPSGAVNDVLTQDFTGAGTHNLGNIEFEEPGTYEYEITEIPGSADYLYDASKYTVTYEVSYTGTTLTATPSYKKDGSAATSVSFTNVQNGSVQVSKTVTGNASDPMKEFNFTIILKDSNDVAWADRIITVGGNDKTTTSDGKVDFKLKHGESVVIGKLPHGTKYTITENDAADYTVVKSNDSGTIRGHASYTNVSFTNTRSYTPTAAVLGINKRIQGTDQTAQDIFEYQLKGISKPASVTNIPMPGGATGDTVSISKAGAGDSRDIKFDSIEFSVPGTYVYEVTEIAGTGNYQYDDKKYTVTCEVSTSSSTGLSLQADTSITQNGNPANAITFTNVQYGAVKVSKAVAGNASDPNREFDFTITLTDSSRVPMADKSITVGGNAVNTTHDGKAFFKLKHGESVVIGKLPHGTRYSVTEENDDYTVSATNRNGTVEGYSSASTQKEVLFTNTRNYTPVTVDPPVRKVVVDTNKSDPFTYSMSAVSNTVGIDVDKMPMPAGSSNGVKQIIEYGEGSYEFGEFEIDLPGTYVYKIVEEKGNLKYNYDKSVYIVTYEVTASGTTLKAVTSIKKDGNTASEIKFTNTYLGKAVLEVEKTCDVSDAKPGDIVSYTISVTNTGDNDAENVRVVDVLNDNLIYLTDDSNGSIDGQSVTWIMDVPANETSIVVLKCEIKEGASGDIVNTVNISGTGTTVILKGTDIALLTIPDDPSDKSIDTSDKTNTSFFIIVMLISAAGILSIGYRRKRD